MTPILSHWGDPDCELARERAGKRITDAIADGRMVRPSEWFAQELAAIRVQRSCGIDPHAPNGEDGRADAPLDLASDGTWTPAPFGDVVVVAAFLALIAVGFVVVEACK